MQSRQIGWRRHRETELDLEKRLGELAQSQSQADSAGITREASQKQRKTEADFARQVEKTLTPQQLDVYKRWVDTVSAADWLQHPAVLKAVAGDPRLTRRVAELQTDLNVRVQKVWNTYLAASLAILTPDQQAQLRSDIEGKEHAREELPPEEKPQAPQVVPAQMVSSSSGQFGLGRRSR